MFSVNCVWTKAGSGLSVFDIDSYESVQAAVQSILDCYLEEDPTKSLYFVLDEEGSIVATITCAGHTCPTVAYATVACLHDEVGVSCFRIEYKLDENGEFAGSEVLPND